MYIGETTPYTHTSHRHLTGHDPWTVIQERYVLKRIKRYEPKSSINQVTDTWSKWLL
jgi:hypothetical protein